MDDMADLEKDMDNTTMRNDSGSTPGSPSATPSNTGSAGGRGPTKGGVLPPGAMPTTKSGGLSNVANEFWFPESRNCPCCKGYKHGCKCRVGSVESCQDPGCTTTASSVDEVVNLEPIKPRHKPKIVLKSATAPAPAGSAEPTPSPTRTAAAAPVVATAAPASPASVTGTPCTFFSTPAGCRFGTSCRFSHGPGAAAAAPQGGGAASSAQPCVFFKDGNCKYGQSCRFLHVM